MVEEMLGTVDVSLRAASALIESEAVLVDWSIELSSIATSSSIETFSFSKETSSFSTELSSVAERTESWVPFWIGLLNFVPSVDFMDVRFSSKSGPFARGSSAMQADRNATRKTENFILLIE